MSWKLGTIAAAVAAKAASATATAPATTACRWGHDPHAAAGAAITAAAPTNAHLQLPAPAPPCKRFAPFHFALLRPALRYVPLLLFRLVEGHPREVDALLLRRGPVVGRQHYHGGAARAHGIELFLLLVRHLVHHLPAV